MLGLEALSAKLCEASRKHYIDVHARILTRFAAPLDPDQWFVSPELISIYGTPAYEDLDEAQQKKLSFYETVIFFSFSARGEQLQVEGLAQRLYQDGMTPVTPYLHCFLEEENNHMAYFGRFCVQFAGGLYPSIYQRRTALTGNWAEGEEDFMFFLKLLVFEELGDSFNVRVAADARVCPLVRDIHRFHHQDEARHLAFGRRIVQELFERYSGGWNEQVLTGIRKYIGEYLVASWGEFYNHYRIYRDAGLPDPRKLREGSFSPPRRRAHAAGSSPRTSLKVPPQDEDPRWPTRP